MSHYRLGSRHARSSSVRLTVAALLLLLPALLLLRAVRGQTIVTTVSAADFRAPVAPESIVASFGTELATGVKAADTIPLPTDLLGTVVTIRDAAGVSRVASLLFVSPGQINYLIPSLTAPGLASVSIRAGNGKTSQGQVQISSVAPAIFTANQDGQGVPAADVLRVLANGSQVTESASVPGANQRFVPRPIDMGASGDKVFLILYLTGVRKAPNTDGNNGNGSAESVRIVMGGLVITPLYAGPQGAFEGLDQINVEVPRSVLDPTLPGAKQLAVSVNVTGFTDSNDVEIAIAPPAGGAPLEITGITSPDRLLVNSLIELTGSGISSAPDKNKISFGEGSGDPRLGEVKSASASTLAAIVPFGATSGSIALNSDGKKWTSPNPLAVRTSFSAVIKDTEGQLLAPVVGARICFPDCVAGALTTILQPGGWFVLPDPPVGQRRVFVIEPVPANTVLPFNRTLISSQILADRDNHLAQDVFLQAIYGPSGSVGTGGGFAPKSSRVTAAGPALNLTIEGFVFSLPAGAQATFPNGSTTGTVTLTPVKNSLTPVPLPTRVFSSSMVQLSPFGVRLNPGGQLVFPNTDQLPQSPQPALYKYDLVSASIVDTGFKGTVSDDGRSISTPPGSITEGSIYFVAVPQKTTTIVGRVLDFDRITPVQGVQVTAGSTQTTTDGNGGFRLEDVIVPRRTGALNLSGESSPNGQADGIQVGASYLRPSGRTDTAAGVALPVVVDGITMLATLYLTAPTSNRPPAIFGAGYVSIYAIESRDIPILVVDLDPGPTGSNLTVTGASFASLINNGGGSFALRLRPGVGDAGAKVLELKATDPAGGTASVEVSVLVLPLPTADPLALVTPEDTPKSFVLTGTDAGALPLTFTVLSQPQKGMLSGTGPNLTYTPAANVNGNDSFTFKVGNGIVDSLPATVTIRIDPVNDGPAISLSCPETQTVVILQQTSCVVTASDPDGSQGLVLSAQNLPFGAIFDPATGVFNWTPQPAQLGTNPVTFSVSDSATPPLTASRTVSYQVVNPAPQVFAISPISALTGSPAFSLTVFGFGFIPGSEVLWNGSPRATTFVSSTSVEAVIPASELLTGGVIGVTVVNPGPGGGQSSAVTFTVINVAPVLNNIVPNTLPAGGPAFIVMVNGSSFVSTSQVLWNGSPRPTTFINSGQLQANITANDIAAPGSANVSVFTPAPGGGVTSNAVFTIADPTPVISGTNPASATAGTAGFGLEVNGLNFNPAAVVRWNGSPRPTTFNGPTQLVATIPASDLTVAGMVNLTVVNPGPLTSAPFPFTVNNPAPVVGMVTPNNTQTGSPDTPIIVTGSGFVTTSVIRFNGMPLTTAFASGTELTATIPSTALTPGAIANITVQNAVPGGGTSVPVTFTIFNPVPGPLGLFPGSATASGPAFNMALDGSNFVPNSVVRWNGNARSTTFIDPNSLSAMIPASDIATAGTANVTVFNPTPVGGESPIRMFSINNPLPVASTLNPPEVPEDSLDFNLIVTGSDFVSTSEVHFMGSARATTFNSSNQLTALIPAADVVNQGGFNITVFNPAPGGGTSAALVLTVGNPVPILNTVDPSSVIAGSGAVTITANGSRFVPGAEIRVNGMGRATLFLNANQVSTQITAPETQVPTIYSITVFNPGPAGGVSGSVNFIVTAVFGPSTTSWAEEFSGVWSRTGPLNSPRDNLIATRLTNGKVLITGGILVQGGLGASIPSNAVEVFDPETGAWKSVSPMHFARNGHSATLLSLDEAATTRGLVLVVGGESVDAAGSYRFAEIYDAVTESWRLISGPAAAHIRHTAIQLKDGRVLIVGGEDGQGGLSTEVEIFDPVNEEWSRTGALNAPRVGHGAVLLPDGRVLVVGGTSTGIPLQTAEIYDPSSGQWTDTRDLNVARSAHSTTLLTDGRVLVSGGEGEEAASTAEVFDPRARQWSLIRSLTSARFGHTATLLEDGTVLVGGGQTPDGQLLLSCELFDPQLNVWTTSPDLIQPRAGHYALRLANGRVLVVGGQGGLGSGVRERQAVPGSSQQPRR